MRRDLAPEEIVRAADQDEAKREESSANEINDEMPGFAAFGGARLERMLRAAVALGGRSRIGAGGDCRAEDAAIHLL